MAGIDPVSLGLSGLQTAVGIGQTIGGLIQAHKAQKGLSNLVNSYTPNSSILDHYNKALARYSSNPYQSALYRQQMQSAGRGLTTGINTLNDRRSILGGIGNLVQGYNDASLKAAATAEGDQGQQLGQLGQAAGMKAQEEKYPFELKYNMLASKAQGGNQIMNAGLQNAFGGLGSAMDYNNLNKLYGNSNSTNKTDKPITGVYSPTYDQYRKRSIMNYRR